MKTISILKTLINIYFYVLIISLLFVVPLIISSMYDENVEKQLSIFGQTIDIHNVSTLKLVIFAIIVIAFFMLFIRAIYLLKLTLKPLSRQDYFSQKVIINFNKAGTLFIIFGLGQILIVPLLTLLIFGSFSFKLEASVMLFIIMGLFLKFLSEVFTKGNSMKQENELTI